MIWVTHQHRITTALIFNARMSKMQFLADCDEVLIRQAGHYSCYSVTDIFCQDHSVLKKDVQEWVRVVQVGETV